jgi:hypothetical protein
MQTAGMTEVRALADELVEVLVAENPLNELLQGLPGTAEPAQRSGRGRRGRSALSRLAHRRSSP